MSDQPKTNRMIPRMIAILVPLGLLAVGGGALAYFTATPPKIQRQSPQRQAAVVEVQTVHPQETQTLISAMGTVVPAREVTLKARVAGEIQSVAAQFVPGGFIAKGEVLMSLDPSDHEVAVQKARSALADVRAELALEQGSQNIAREELQLLSELSTDSVSQTDLALRKPQLMQAEAAVTSAEADLRQALLDLERTVIRAPFNAMIIERSVNIGTYVGVQDSLATLVGTDEFWVEAVVPLDQLALIDLNSAGGASVQIRSQAGSGQWDGRVMRMAGKLNETSRMATIIVAVSDPLGESADLSASRLMIDDYVSVEISGRSLSEVIELPRAALQDGDSVWLCSADNTLDIRPVTLAWKSSDKVYIQSGLSAGQQVVISELATPVQGMPLKILTAKKSDDGTQPSAESELKNEKRS